MIDCFFIGDFSSNTGPANVNKLIKKALKEEKITFSNSNNKLLRVSETLVKVLVSKNICMCSYSEINFFVIKLSRLFNKRIYYLMHGYRTHETKINYPDISTNEIAKINKKEKQIFHYVNKVFCVSKSFMNFMRKAEPNYIDKFDYNYNPIDIQSILYKSSLVCSRKKKNQLISLGGGMKRKNNLILCKAIDELNKRKCYNLKFIVIGQAYTDMSEMIKYDFVEYYESISHEKVLELFSESNIFIQNSVFESFGLAILEALYSKCNLLISNNVGCKDILSNIEESDIIYDNNNIDEIALKIENILNNENNTRLVNGILTELIEYRSSVNLLMCKIMNHEREASWEKYKNE